MTVTIICEDQFGMSTVTAVDVTMVDDYLEVAFRAMKAAGFIPPETTTHLEFADG